MNDAEAPSVGTRTRAARIDASYSLRDLAARSGLSISTLSRIENGNTPSSRSVALLAESLGVSSDWLLGVPCTEAKRGTELDESNLDR